MEHMNLPTTVLDVSRGFGFGLLYHPVIGEIRSKKNYPFLLRFSLLKSKKIKKRL